MRKRKPSFSRSRDVFVGRSDGNAVQTEFQFDFQDGGGTFGQWRAKHKLFRYISAGGLGQTRRTSADDIAEARSRSFLVFIAVLVAIWTFFYFLPCE